MRGELDDLLTDEQLEAHVAASWLAAAASKLATLREEGLPLWPELYFISDVRLLAGVMQGAEFVKLGTGPRTDDTVIKALKDCAPLAQGGWVIFVESSGDNLTYGLLSPTNLPLALTPYEALVETAGGLPCVVIRRVAESCVEVQGGRGNRICLYMSDQRSDTPSPMGAIEKFCGAATRTVVEPARADTTRYLYRTLVSQLIESHGTLMAVQSGLRRKIPEQLSDCVRLPQPLSIARRIAEYREHKDEEAVAKIASATALLKGMLGSDGIILFRSDASITAYRAFLRLRASSQLVAPGGARRRTFEGLKTLVGRELEAVLMRSQDGLTEFYGSNDA